LPDDVELDVTAMVAGGDGLAREASGRVVFVRGALPGERVAARFTEERKDFAKAVMTRVIVASPDRVQPPCRFVAEGCGGCDWQHASADAQTRYKRDLVVDALRRIGRLADPLVHDCVRLPTERYRTTVRVATDGEGRPGFRKAESHELVVVDDCLVAHPAIVALLATEAFPPVEEVVLRVADEETIAGRRFVVSPESFFQIRPDGAAALVQLVGDALVARHVSSVVDLYAGVGLFAGTLHDRGFDVRAAVEGNPSAIVDARENLANVCDVVDSDVAKWPGLPVDAVVADPSRQGLMKGGVATIVRCDPSVVVLVSCDVAALGRDAKLLAEAGYLFEECTPVDLFSQTAHVEVVSAFVKSR
jgi:23S rRNA (uracil1939-C5)-methyltransferase